MKLRRLRSSTRHSGHRWSASATASRGASRWPRSHSPSSSIVLVVPCSTVAIRSTHGTPSGTLVSLAAGILLLLDVAFACRGGARATPASKRSAALLTSCASPLDQCPLGRATYLNIL